MEISNIDDVLHGGKSTIHPETPEHNAAQESETPTYDEISESPEESTPEQEIEASSEAESHENNEANQLKDDKEIDDYGNEQPKENEAIRERLKKQARKYEAEIDQLRAQLAQQGASPQIQQAAKNFEYQPEESGDWQQQLSQFVKQTVSSMNQESQVQQQRHTEMQAQREFESKFRESMNKFDDFAETIHGLNAPITDAMTIATRAMSDPAAFLYAAAKRQPKELERISNIRDPYVQMTEMGKLEERMRKNKSSTKAPRPLGKTGEDSHFHAPKKAKESTIEDLIAKSEAKKIAQLKLRRGR